MMDPSVSHNVIAFPIQRRETEESCPHLLMEEVLLEPRGAEQLESPPWGKVIELFPGCLEPQRFTHWNALSHRRLYGENQALQVRRNRALDQLKKTFQDYPEQLMGIFALEALNQELCDGTLSVADAEVANQRKIQLVIQASLPLQYLKIDNATWTLEWINQTVHTLNLSRLDEVVMDIPELEELIAPRRLLEFQELKDSLYAELEEAETSLAEHCHRHHQRVQNTQGSWWQGVTKAWEHWVHHLQKKRVD